MSVARIATRYAKSLIDLSVEQNKLDRILEDIESFQKATENRDFYLMLKSPIINSDKKIQIFERLFKRALDRNIDQRMVVVTDRLKYRLRALQIGAVCYQRGINGND